MEAAIRARSFAVSRPEKKRSSHDKIILLSSIGNVFGFEKEEKKQAPTVNKL